MKFSEQVKATLWNLIDQMSLHVADFTVHPDQDFTRKKKWDFPSLLKFIISMESQSLKNELLKYFDYATNCPSTASFNQRRAQVRAEAFQFLFNAFTAKYDVNPKLFKGYRLIACDRSGVNIAYNPNDKESYMSNGSAKGYNQYILMPCMTYRIKYIWILLYSLVKVKMNVEHFVKWFEDTQALPKQYLLLTGDMNHTMIWHM